MTTPELFQVRLALIQAFLRENAYDGVLLTRPDNFAMATGGKRNYIWRYSDAGANALFVSKTGRAWFVGDNIEETRVMAEELRDLGVGTLSYLWFEHSPAEVVQKEFSGALVSDNGSLGLNVHADLAPLRALLTLDELEKYRRLGKLAADAMTETLALIQPGMAEADIAAALIAAGERRRCHVPVALIAADERIPQFRHPLPTAAPLLGSGLEERSVQRYVMVVGCFLREGLVVSMTRFRQVDGLESDLLDRYARICGVDALMQEATRPGKTLGDVFEICQQAYASLGFAANEWHNHHQGGATGYAGRTSKGHPGNAFPVLDTHWPQRASELLGRPIECGAAFAWNPSAPGVKSEDTFILLPDGTQEIVSRTPELPEVDLAKVLGKATEVQKYGIMT